MADASLTDVVQELKELKSAVKSGDSTSATAVAKAAETAREAAGQDAKRMGIFQSISDKLNIFKGMKPGDDTQTTGFFGKLLSGFKLGGLVTGFGTLLTTGLSTAFGGLGKLFGPQLIKVLGKIGPIAMIVAGISMAIEDGITSMLSSSDWGTSKTSAFLGGFFGGSADGGIKNAFTNAGKWALIGAGVGSFIPVVGTIAGGLIGAVIGGILGFIGAEKLAKSFDGIGIWFSEKFTSLIIDPIKNIWDIIAPDWAKSVTGAFKWSDLLPDAVTKLLNGEYFTIEFPDIKFEWTDLLPPFLKKFFAGEYAPGKDEFEWRDLLPPFLKKLFEHDWIKPTGSFEWSDLVPKFISDLIAAEKGKKEGDEFDFDWRRLLPEWMVGAFDSTKGMLTRTKGRIEDFFADIAMGIKNRMVSIIDSIADKVPFLTSTAEAATDKLKEIGGFTKRGFGLTGNTASEIDFKKLRQGLLSGALIQSDIAGLIKDQSDDLTNKDLIKLGKLAGAAATGMNVKNFEGGQTILSNSRMLEQSNRGNVIMMSDHRATHVDNSQRLVTNIASKAHVVQVREG
jgi:hypothetical protein